VRRFTLGQHLTSVCFNVCICIQQTTQEFKPSGSRYS
jgi:hypothetical protein